MNQKLKTYNKFPDYYDEIIRGNGYDIDSEISFLDEMMNRFGKGKHILEFACGTGTIAKELISKGFTVTGVDLSEQMIEKAKKSGHPQGDAPTQDSRDVLYGYPEHRFIIGDMTSINLQKEFDIVLCNYNSVCHLPDWEAWILFFENAYKHLKKDGVLIFDILTLFEFENISRDYKGFFNVGGDTICLEMFKSSPQPSPQGEGVEQNIFKWLIKMFVDKGDNQFELTEEEIREISFPISKIKKELEEIGFSIEHTEDFHFGEVTAESERVYFVAKK